MIVFKYEEGFAMSITGLQVIELISRAKMTGEQRQRHKNCQKWIKKAGHVTQKKSCAREQDIFAGKCQQGLVQEGACLPKSGVCSHDRAKTSARTRAQYPHTWRPPAKALITLHLGGSLKGYT